MHAVAQPMSSLLVVGTATVASLFFGKLANRLRLPSLIGFMLVGVLAGPSVAGFLDEPLQERLSFLTQIALAFVAVSIGLELNVASLRRLGKSIVLIILSESFGAFLVVFALVYVLSRDVPMALIFGAVAPASAPAGTVAIIREYRARGPLTKALYAVVGFDDGLGIVIFGFAAAVARSLVLAQTGSAVPSVASMVVKPAVEVVGGLLCGAAGAVAFSVLGRRLRSGRDLFILLFGFTLMLTGLCVRFHLSVILTNMVVGMVIVNTQPRDFGRKLGQELTSVMPLLFVLFFTLAGANLHVAALPALGVLGLVYIVGRSLGLVYGAKLGALVGRAEPKIRKYLGWGILSQAGVAIGLSLIVKHDFAGIGAADASGAAHGDLLGATVITTVTATCIFFEIVGPILTKVALTRAGELGKAREEP